jgi:hypothetical protein
MRETLNDIRQRHDHEYKLHGSSFPTSKTEAQMRAECRDIIREARETPWRLGSHETQLAYIRRARRDHTASIERERSLAASLKRMDR